MSTNKSVSKFSNCYGCGVCSITCPVNAISFTLKDGYFHISVDDSLCIDCGKCLRTCSYELFSSPLQSKVCGSYSAWSRDDETRYTSTSGGILYEISKSAISSGYKIVGVRYDYSKNIAKHFIFDSIDELALATGSKYIQSYTLDALVELTTTDKYVVIGLPCMIASLRRYIESKNLQSNFILIDFFCHGVPSYAFYWKYLDYLRNQIGDISSIKFRSKRKGWQRSTSIEAIGSKGEYFRMMSEGDIFFNFFLRNRCLNPVCYDSCHFKATSSLADIRVGDFWGTKYSKNDQGINSVLSFTSKGEELLSHIQDSCVINKEPTTEVLKGQMKTNAVRSKSYKIVSILLSHNYSLRFIAFVADIIDDTASLPKRFLYYWHRLPYKLHLKK
jgi:coenzyme F420-reducing hydrogenase beta subunit